MSNDTSLLSILLAIISLPFQLYQLAIWSGLSFLTVDVLGLGPFLFNNP